MAVRSKADGHHATYKPLTMDDLPVPKVPWQEYHSKTNAKYNLVLVGGITLLAASIYVVSITIDIIFLKYTQYQCIVCIRYYVQSVKW